MIALITLKRSVIMSYCNACGYDDQASEEMIDVLCQNCGAMKHKDGSVSYEDDRQRAEEFDRKYNDYPCY